MSGVVLVTGVARPLAAELALRLLACPGVARVVGVDTVVPEADLGGVEFIQADIRDPLIGKVLASCAADTVVHAVVQRPGGGRAAQKETNVIGAMQLLAACQRTARVAKLVVCSTTAVYGASPRDPALFTEDEDFEPTALPRSGVAKDAIEVEGYVRGFTRRRPDVTVTVLRLADTLGPGADSPLAGYFALPVLPTVLGFDARLQVLHPADALEALRRAVVGEHPGAFNVAGDGVVLLSQAARWLGRPSVPVAAPVLDLMGALLRRAGRDDLSAEHVRLLTYGRVVDTTRLRERFGFVPAYSTARTFEEFAATAAAGGCPPAAEQWDRAQRLLGALAGASGRSSDG